MDTEERKYTLDIISSMAERTTKRLIIVIILLIAVIVAGVIGFVIREDGYAIEKTEIEASTEDGGTVMTNMMGVMNYGDRQDNDNKASEETNNQEDNQRN